MKKSSYIGMFRTVASVIVALVSALVVSSCNGMIYDDQGDCSAKYRLMFRYDYNMKFADAFAHEVKSVAVYAFDVDGNMVWHGTAMPSTCLCRRATIVLWHGAGLMTESRSPWASDRVRT